MTVLRKKYELFSFFSTTKWALSCLLNCKQERTYEATIIETITAEVSAGMCSAEEMAYVESWYNQLSKTNNAKDIPELDLAAEDRYFQQHILGPNCGPIAIGEPI
ncbi:hypothetical protein KUH03_01535 [Sphingobacterium sp. E70]|nr:hypothetical protein [Sphingobacterium sp. E70]ULT25711.1 hypothetical protein KUH03_01535 [Sphingobacterium sp. E70]